MGLVVLSLMLLVNSPLLNFQSIATSSQLSRLGNGDIDNDNFDYHYFGNSLGRQGYLKLQALKAEMRTTYPEKVMLIDRMYKNIKHKPQEKINQVEFEKLVTFWPSKASFPTNLIEIIFEKETENTWSRYIQNSYYFLVVDLNKDEKEEFVIITENNNSTSGQLWQLKDNKWESTYMTVSYTHLTLPTTPYV